MRLRAEVPFFEPVYAEVDRRHPDGARKLKFNEALKHVFDQPGDGLDRKHSAARLQASGVRTVEDVRQQQKRLAGFSSGGRAPKTPA